MVKCTSYNCNSIRNNSEIVKALLQSSDIVFLQEIMLNRSDLFLLNDFHPDFKYAAFVKDRDAEGINEGRPSRGVAIFWRRNLSSIISPVLINDFIIGVVLKYENKKFLFLNVYMPCDLQNFDSLDRYRHALATLDVIVKEQDINNVILVGDFNADPSKGRFWKELVAFCESLPLECLHTKLPHDTFTYLCPAKSTTSWLDHILCSAQAVQYFSNIYVDYNCAIYDHFPLCFDFNLFVNTRKCASNSVSTDKLVNWNKLSDLDKDSIERSIEDNIADKGILDCQAFSCFNVNCKNENHIQEIDSKFTDLKSVLLESTETFSVSRNVGFKVIPGWNDEVKELHAVAREKFLLWKKQGRPLSSRLCEDMKYSRTLFKSALNQCKLNEKLIKKKKLLNNLDDKNYGAFWSEVKQTNKNNLVYPDNIDGYDKPNDICNLFSQKYKLILNKQGKPPAERLCKLNMKEKEKVWFILRFSQNDIKRAIKCLKPGIGFDNIHSFHLKLSPDICHEVLSALFYGFVMHNCIPLSMLRGVITPIIKDKFGDQSSSDNYRPVMSSSVFLKVLEYCILNKIGPYIRLNDRQHGFRANHSTSSACLVLKETILNYTNSNSDVYACFVDISKAFDSVDHGILMNKLTEYGVPDVFVKLIRFWYSNQLVNVRYMSEFSDEWEIRSGVRQGGILSGLFFEIYIDTLLNKISEKKIGCRLGIVSSNIVAYADDMVLLAPSAKGLNMLIDDALKEALNINLRFNLKKTKCMIFRSSLKVNKVEVVSPIRLDGSPVEIVRSFKYLGYIITNDLNDSEDIQRVRNKFYADFNSMIRNFSFADGKVKLFLFKQYCLQMYGCDLWFLTAHSAASFKQFAVGYHKAVKKLLDLSYHESNHYACQEAQLYTFQHLINKCRIMNAIRLISKPCNFIQKVMSYFSVSSVFLRQVYDFLEQIYDIDSLLYNDRDAIVARIAFVQNRERQMREPAEA